MPAAVLANPAHVSGARRWLLLFSLATVFFILLALYCGVLSVLLPNQMQAIDPANKERNLAILFAITSVFSTTITPIAGRTVRPHPHAIRPAHAVDRGGFAGRRHVADDLLADADAMDHHLLLGAGGRVAQFHAGRVDHRSSRIAFPRRKGARSPDSSARA